MSFIDKIASLPYRFFGILLILISIILAIPLVVIPMFLTLISQGRTFNDAYNLGYEVLKNCTLRELLEILKDATILTRIAGFFIKNITKGMCMILAGIYYSECYEDVLNLK